MPYVYPALPTLVNQALSDLTDYLGYTPLWSSNEYIFGLVSAGLVDDQYKYIDYVYSQCTPFTATNEYLAAWATLTPGGGITRNPATYASGTVAFTGNTGTVVAANTKLIGTNQITYGTGAEFIIGTTSSVALTALTAGSSGNAPAGMALTLISPQTGVQSGTSALTEITGGVDTETDSSLRTRMLQRYAAPSQGGAVSDYIGWALASNTGCTRAWAIGDNLAPGSVTVFPMFDVTEAANGGFPVGSNGVATQETRYPTVATGDQLAIANYIYPLRPVTALVYVQAPLPQYFSMTISGIGFSNVWTNGTWSSTPTTTETNIILAIQEVLIEIGTVYGGTVAISDLYAAIGSVTGIGSFTITNPTTTIETAIGSLPVLYAVTLTA